jgi:hypothetical protein
MEKQALRKSSPTSTNGMSFCHIYNVNTLTLIRIAAVPSFPGLRRFPEGRGFKQWTGDDSKALMKVRAYLKYPSHG